MSKILLVGGLSDSKYIQKAIRAEFPDKQVIVPEDAGLCVVKGAVLFGRDPKLISHRVVRYTYGVMICPRFDETRHHQSKKFIAEGVERCDKVFLSFIRVGTVVEMNKKVVEELETVYKFQKILKVSLYVSSNDDPKYVDEDGCKLVGYLNVSIPNPTKEKRDIEVTLIFGNTEIQVKGKDVLSGKTCETSLNFVLF